MNKHEIGEIRRSHVRARMYQPAAMPVHGIVSMPVKKAGVLMAVDSSIFAEGNHGSVLTVENIRHTYGVEALVKSDGERPYIIPVRPV